jgi:RNA polymerase sigma factor (sigma-70 family)
MDRFPCSRCSDLRVHDAPESAWNHILAALARGRAPEHDPAAWWRRAARNTLLNKLRRRDALDEPNKVEQLDTREGPEGLGPWDGAGAALELQEWSESLSARQRSILKLLCEGWSGREIAKALGLSAVTVSRERQKLWAHTMHSGASEAT